MRVLLILVLLLQGFGLAAGSGANAANAAACGCACAASSGTCCPTLPDDAGDDGCTASLGTALCACSARPAPASAERASTLPIAPERIADGVVGAVAFSASPAVPIGSPPGVRVSPFLVPASACALLCIWRS